MRVIEIPGGVMEIRGCPFCGNPAADLMRKRGENGFRDVYYVLCNYDKGGCGGSGGWRHSQAEAVGCWNERRRKREE